MTTVTELEVAYFVNPVITLQVQVSVYIVHSYKGMFYILHTLTMIYILHVNYDNDVTLAPQVQVSV